MSGRNRQILLGVVGGAVSTVLTLWLRLYMPSTDSFADLRDAPAILLAFFTGPLSALVAGAMASMTRAAVGLFGGVGAATWFASSLATFVAALMAVAARKLVFRGERPSFALAAMIAVIAEMLHMAVVLTVGSAEFTNSFAVIVAAIPFQCGGVAVLAAVASLLVNRRQDRRENLIVAALFSAVIAFVILVYFAMEHQAMDMVAGRLPMTANLHMYPCNLATVLYGIVLSVLAFAFAVYAKRIATERAKAVPSGGEGTGRFRIGIRGKFAISLVVMLGVLGGVTGVSVSVGYRMECERGYSETALFLGQLLAKYIDGERVRDYYTTGRKDAYYEDVKQLLLYVRKASDLKYLYVIVPEENRVTYIWDTGDEDTGEVGELGEHDDILQPTECQVLQDVLQQKIKFLCIIHRRDQYGYLMSVVVPILGADDKPFALVCVDLSMDVIDHRVNRIVFCIALVTLVLALLCLAGFYFFVSRFIVSPAEQQIRGEEERIHAELNVARKIQADALPNVFPAFPDHSEFDIYAMMVPAKAVGGDFYDFFLVDETHLALVIGDVSDKGVPAALFMMTAKTLIKARTYKGGTPAEILRDVNDQLCEGNRSGMFVTVYLAVIDLATGEGRSANAGHEHPILRRAGGDFAHVKYQHDPMLGLVPDLSYSDRTFRLSPGDTLLVYTDGVTESATVQRTFYGMDRITTFLNGRRELSLESLLKSLRADIATFAGAAPQSDDITLLAVTYNGAQG